MHDISVRQEILDRLMARRGRVNFYEKIDPSRTALVVIDMQNTFAHRVRPPKFPHREALCQTLTPLQPSCVKTACR